MRLAAVAFTAFALLVGGARADEEVTFPTAPGERFDTREQVTGYLDLPSGANGKVPAVIVIHTAGGYDRSHNELYAAPLRAAGIATLGLALFRGGANRLPSQFIPHVYGAFKYLAFHPRIDPARIGTMGMSLGGLLSLYVSSELLSRQHLGESARFAGHAGLYPVCWVHEAIATGTLPTVSLRDVYAKLTGAPVLLLAGEKDDDDDPDSCQKYLAALSPEARKAMEFTMFSGATHAWDSGSSYRYFDRIANRGKGGYVNVVFEPTVTAKGRDVVVAFFVKHLAAAK